jgi:hypothetical protein
MEVDFSNKGALNQKLVSLVRWTIQQTATIFRIAVPLTVGKNNSIIKQSIRMSKQRIFHFEKV